MKILADENIPYVREAFSHLGDVSTATGEMNNAMLADVDVLLVRSVTQVNAELVHNSPLKFVATATIGTDHIDFAALKKQGIGFASAPGSNAESVAQYVTSALQVYAEQRKIELQGTSIGIVGVGNVGSRVARNAEAMGMEVLLNDPPLHRESGDAKYLPLDNLFAVDIITLHLPLITTGEVTHHLVDGTFLERMKPSALLINTARGAIVDNNALLEALQSGTIADAILDVWENEPAIEISLLEQVFLGTPHIAGYSFDGKVRGTEMIYQAVCKHFDINPKWTPQADMPLADVPRIELDSDEISIAELIRSAVLKVYDIRADDQRMRKLNQLSSNEQSAYFDRLRKEYPRRREFLNTVVALTPHNVEIARRLSTLQFHCPSDDSS